MPINKEVFLQGFENNFANKSYISGLKDLFKSLNSTLKNDKDIVLTFVKKDGSILREVNSTFKKDKEVVLAAIHSGSMFALSNADISLTKDKEVVLAAVYQSKESLKYVHESIRNDEDVILSLMEGMAK